MSISNEMKIEFDAKSENEGFARVSVAAFFTQLDPTLEEIADIKTAISEAVTNAIIHGYEDQPGKVEIYCYIKGNEGTILVKDQGRGIEDIKKAMEPLYTTKPELDRSGMGFAFMEAFMDYIFVESNLGKGTTITMKKKIGSEEKADVKGKWMADTITLIQRSHDGDKGARDQLVQSNLGLVWSIVRRFEGRGYELEDLFQIGSIGLMKAIDKFDLSFEVKFSTYAVPMICGEIKRFLRDDGMVKVSRSLKENGWKIKQAMQRLSQQFGRDVTLEEVAKETALTVEDIVVALDANVEVESLYKTVYQGEGNEITLVDKIPEKKDEQEKVLNHIVIEQMLEELDYKEKSLIQLRYYQEKTQTEVAKQLGISQVQVSRLEKKILLRMRAVLVET